MFSSAATANSSSSRLVRFSVIIPIHEAVGTLDAALDSVFDQLFTDYEVILVDDHSSDSWAGIVARHPLTPRVIRLAETRGPGAARNAGIAAARGEYITFLDSDDTWFPWTLDTFDAVIRAASKPSFISGRELRGEQPPSIENALPAALKTSGHPDYFATADTHLWTGVGGVAIERSAIARVGGFDESNANCEDSDLWLRLGQEPGFIRIETPRLFFYRQTNHGLTKEPDRVARGYMNLVAREKASAYPGGANRRRQRLILITRHTRAGTCQLLESGHFREALTLYAATFSWNLILLRFKYLVGFWLLALTRTPRTEFQPSS